MEQDIDFVIGVPKYHKVFFIVILAVGGTAGAVLAVLFLTRVLSFSSYWGALAVAVAALIYGGIGLYVSIKEKFILSGGVFTYIKPFKKSQTTKAEDVSKVAVERTSSRFVNVIFWGKNGKKLINFYDDGTIAENTEFSSALMSLGITYENLF